MTKSDDEKAVDVYKGVLLIMFIVALVISMIILAIWGFRAFGRLQAIADANNNAQIARIVAANEKEVNALRIAAQEQKVLIAQQDAKVREEQALGIKAAQDTISQTLTPLYVQMQMIEALENIAKSGKNATVIYIPIDPKSGLPVVAPVSVK